LIGTGIGYLAHNPGMGGAIGNQIGRMFSGPDTTSGPQQYNSWDWLRQRQSGMDDYGNYIQT